MTRLAWIGVFALALAVFLPSGAEPAHAITRPACTDHGAAVAALARNYGERLIARAVTTRGAILEIFASTKGRDGKRISWTAIITFPGGPACIVAAGRDWGARKQGRNT